MQKKLLFIFGTRPEAIKFAPLIIHAKSKPEFTPIVCVTAQHREMLDQVLNFFEIKPDYDLNLMKPNQDLSDITSSILLALKDVIAESNPDIVLVQGDTTTAFVGAMAAFYAKKKVAHIEAGLRSGDILSPYPEECYRKMISTIGNYHFAPTKLAASNLAKENITDNVYVTGNTVIDALFLGLDIIKDSGEDEYKKFFNFIDSGKRLVLITGHRRESFGKPFDEMFLSFKQLAQSYPDVEFVYPVHLNPNVKDVAYAMLGDIENFHLIAPLEYRHMIWLMQQSYFIITDSGGIQEEAPALGKPVLVTRNVTERTEAIEAGCAKLVGSDSLVIIREASALLDDFELYRSMSSVHSPYGDGMACERILKDL